MTAPLPSDETSKAVQEVAKTAGKAIGAAEKFGGFIAKYVAGPLQEGMGIFEDRLKYMRWERQVRLMARADELMRQLGRSAATHPLPLKLAIPLLEAASLEDDDYLQDLWARLLVGAATGAAATSLTRAHIAVLEQLSSSDVQILLKIHEVPYEAALHPGLLTSNLPERVEIDARKVQRELPLPSRPVQLALANLARVGCVSLSRSMGGGELLGRVHPTLLGLSLVQACTLATPAGET